MVLKICGVKSASFEPSFTLRASLSKWILQGVISLQQLATPTNGFLKSSSVKPVQRSIALLGARESPSVIMLLLFLRFSDMLINSC